MSYFSAFLILFLLVFTYSGTMQFARCAIRTLVLFKHICQQYKLQSSRSMAYQYTATPMHGRQLGKSQDMHAGCQDNR